MSKLKLALLTLLLAGLGYASFDWGYRRGEASLRVDLEHMQANAAAAQRAMDEALAERDRKIGEANQQASAQAARYLSDRRRHELEYRRLKEAIRDYQTDHPDDACVLPERLFQIWNCAATRSQDCGADPLHGGRGAARALPVPAAADQSGPAGRDVQRGPELRVTLRLPRPAYPAGEGDLPVPHKLHPREQGIRNGWD